MPSKHLNRLLYMGAFVFVLGVSTHSLAQTDFTWTGNGDGSTYGDGNNWEVEGFSGFLPDGEDDAIAIIGNGDTVFVQGSPVAPGQIAIGYNEGQSGHLVVTPTGSLRLYNGSQASVNLSSGGINVGGVGTASLTVQPGGSLESGYIIVQGSGNTVVLDGTGFATTTASIFNVEGKASGFNVLSGNSMRIIGPNVDITSNTFDVDAGATYVAEITGASHSTFKTPNNASADGVLQVEFSGYTPQQGDSWDLIDAPGFNSMFSDVVVVDSNLTPGQTFTFEAVADASSDYGYFGRLSLEQHLYLQVDRNTNEMTIMGGTSPIELDGYTVSSVLGGLNPANWNSLQDDSVGTWRESPQGGATTQLSELEPNGTFAISSSSPVSLGNVFQKPTATTIGSELEDIQFEYFTTDGSVVQGQVVYVGDKVYNDVVLVVDPTSGQAYIQNQSAIPVSIDGYNIHSDSGSLLPNDGDWLSLEDQSVGTWRESGESANNLSELLSSGSVTLSGQVFELGNLFLTEANGGMEDLVFNYLLDGEETFTQGAVVFRDIVQTAGDYNRDGIVNIADYTLWRDNLGRSVSNGTVADGNNDGVINMADYNIWKSNFGLPSSGSVSAVGSANVPEPNSLALVLLASIGLAVRGFRR
ncbi:dockerin type I domain-containing protein [Aeoliella mucimassa]|uniref:Dockerin domain-containing protein n=1 Tax=Aeoliella mucimassa TaxID=2527972 RepID=A0A518AMH8_9BACT|nr:dockerin type I domain-containing protein [Aeoliella mucimassa]QDU55901.1 hypothetical protein Pan181_21030 [Aeoliella mucimassa]